MRAPSLHCGVPLGGFGSVPASWHDIHCSYTKIGLHFARSSKPTTKQELSMNFLAGKICKTTIQHDKGTAFDLYRLMASV